MRTTPVQRFRRFDAAQRVYAYQTLCIEMYSVEQEGEEL